MRDLRHGCRLFNVLYRLNCHFRPFSDAPVAISASSSADNASPSSISPWRVRTASSTCQMGLHFLHSCPRQTAVALDTFETRLLWYLPHCAYLTNRQAEFLRVIDIWWMQLRSNLKTTVTKIPSVLIHLGKLQGDFPEVSIVDKLGGWKSLDLILRRCVEIGFDRYLFTDVNSAVAGLLALLNGGDPKRSIGADQLSSFGALLDSYNTYILRKSPTDADWTNAQESDACVALCLYRQLGVRPPDDVVRKLCGLAKTGFDRRTVSIPDQDRWLTLTNYADALMYFGIDPDALVPGSWRGWFAASARLLEECNDNPTRTTGLPSLCVLSMLPEVAVRFEQLPALLDMFDWWLATVSYSLQGTTKNKDGQLANTVYNLGLLAFKHADIIKAKLVPIASLMGPLQSAFVHAGDVGAHVSVTRVLSGLTYFKWAADSQPSCGVTNGAPPSPILLRALEQHYLRVLASPAAVTSDQCVAAADTLLLLERLHSAPPPKLMRHLLTLVSRTMDRVEACKVEKVLCHSGWACAWYCTTHRPVEYELCQSFWTNWFNAVHRFLHDPRYPSTEERNKRLPHLLFVVIDAAARAKRVDDFGRLQAVWETLAIEQAHCGLTEKRRKQIYFAAQHLIRRNMCVFSAALMRKLDRRYVEKVPATGQ